MEVETGLTNDSLMWRSRADFLKVIQSMWLHPAQVLPASLWVAFMGGPGMGGPPSGGGLGGGPR